MLRKLKAVPHSRGLGFDPQGEFVAAVAASGLLQIWEMLNGKQVLSRKKAGPDVRLTSLSMQKHHSFVLPDTPCGV